MQYLLSDDFFSQRIHNVQQFPFFMQIGRSKEEKVSRSTNCSTATALWILAVMKTVQIFEFSVQCLIDRHTNDKAKEECF